MQWQLLVLHFALMSFETEKETHCRVEGGASVIIDTHSRLNQVDFDGFTVMVPTDVYASVLTTRVEARYVLAIDASFHSLSRGRFTRFRYSPIGLSSKGVYTAMGLTLLQQTLGSS